MNSQDDVFGFALVVIIFFSLVLAIVGVIALVNFLWLTGHLFDVLAFMLILWFLKASLTPSKGPRKHEKRSQVGNYPEGG